MNTVLAVASLLTALSGHPDYRRAQFPTPELVAAWKAKRLDLQALPYAKPGDLATARVVFNLLACYDQLPRGAAVRPNFVDFILSAKRDTMNSIDTTLRLQGGELRVVLVVVMNPTNLADHVPQRPHLYRQVAVRTVEHQRRGVTQHAGNEGF
jgi:hypothetical protein